MIREKIDSRNNVPISTISEMINEGAKLNCGKIDFRINRNTIIKVYPEQATEEFRELYIKKHKLSRNI